jgi:hypothetical protein
LTPALLHPDNPVVTPVEFRRCRTVFFERHAPAGIPERTQDLPAESRQVRRGGEQAWYWYDPAAPWPADAPFPKPNPWEPPEIDPLDLPPP